MADAVEILVEASRAVAAVDFGLVDGVKRADSTTSLEGELSAAASQSTDTTTVLVVTFLADTLSVGNDLVGATGVAVSS